mmetsp:Transcript_1483/g.4386  ORF Transcript_1483/g.4386 Transcript_1483/m.4386 type:complete len:263 (+) Transcript_1483:301-1089(+)
MLRRAAGLRPLAAATPRRSNPRICAAGSWPARRCASRSTTARSRASGRTRIANDARERTRRPTSLHGRAGSRAPSTRCESPHDNGGNLFSWATASPSVCPRPRRGTTTRSAARARRRRMRRDPSGCRCTSCRWTERFSIIPCRNSKTTRTRRYSCRSACGTTGTPRRQHVERTASSSRLRSSSNRGTSRSPQSTPWPRAPRRAQRRHGPIKSTNERCTMRFSGPTCRPTELERTGTNARLPPRSCASPCTYARAVPSATSSS